MGHKRAKKPYRDYTDGDWAKSRHLIQHRNLSDEAWEARKQALLAKEAGLRELGRKPATLEETLVPEDRPAFRQEVKRILDEVVKLGGNREIMRPVAEKASFYGLVVDKVLQQAYTAPEATNPRNLKDMIVGLNSIYTVLGVTPKEQRIAGVKSDESISAAIRRSLENAEQGRKISAGTVAEDAARFGRPIDPDSVAAPVPSESEDDPE